MTILGSQVRSPVETNAHDDLIAKKTPEKSRPCPFQMCQPGFITYRIYSIITAGRTNFRSVWRGGGIIRAGHTVRAGRSILALLST